MRLDRGGAVATGQDAQLLVLTALADGPLHGYAINTAIEQMTGRRLGPGSLYGALTRLEAHGLIEPLPGEGRQQPMQLTETGAVALAEDLQTLARVTARGLRSLGLAPS
jgi:DNA-binding PadR family transcriptional regulator